MAEFGVAAAVAVLGWWFCTGVILLLNHLPRSTHGTSFFIMTLAMLMAAVLLPANAMDTDFSGAVGGFLIAMVLWGWLEMGYLMGFVTGPRSQPCPADASSWQRFQLAVATSVYHELSVIVMVGAVVWLSWGQPNPVAMLSMLTLWLMRWSAKLNLFLGVRNYNGDWLPESLQYLDSYTRRRKMNVLFPFSVLAGVAACVLLVDRAAAAVYPAQALGFAMVATLMALAVLEHGFLMWPMRESVLWAWAMPDRRPMSDPPSS